MDNEMDQHHMADDSPVPPELDRDEPQNADFPPQELDDGADCLPEPEDEEDEEDSDFYNKLERYLYEEPGFYDGEHCVIARAAVDLDDRFAFTRGF